ncbi:hypothetical protein GJ496_002533 [Pomphorhynchus laevis]|nr:hypothetical protein GJ496_002533 [Pomphorhynchus laevis]
MLSLYFKVIALNFLVFVHCSTEPPGHLRLLKFSFDEYGALYTVVLWILVALISRTGFNSFQNVFRKLPESCTLILMGLLVGISLRLMHVTASGTEFFNSYVFFTILLPPIILNSGYFMPSRAFVDNFGTILLFAICNTLFNTLAIGLTMYLFNFTPLYAYVKFEILHCLLFASVISAVDPVAVLATFEEIHVNDTLYIIVFGESLLNDAVSVVLYRVFAQLSALGINNIIVSDIVIGVATFFTNSLAGIFFGIIFGYFGSLLTKYMQGVAVIEPLVILVTAYLSYLTAEIFHASGIIAITVASMLLRQYVVYNIASDSRITTSYCIRMMSTLSESIIFLFMGLTAIDSMQQFNLGLTLLTVISCIVYRTIGVAIFGSIANTFRVNKLSFIDMLVMSYGGLRGAVAYALTLVLEKDIIPTKSTLLSTTLIVIYFTVFLQGMTIGPVVKALNVRKKHVEEPSLSAKLSLRIIDKVMLFIGEMNNSGIGFNRIMLEKMRRFDRKYLRSHLSREPADSSLDYLLLAYIAKHFEEQVNNKQNQSIQDQVINKQQSNRHLTKSDVLSDEKSIQVSGASAYFQGVLEEAFRESNEMDQLSPARISVAVPYCRRMSSVRQMKLLNDQLNLEADDEIAQILDSVDTLPSDIRKSFSLSLSKRKKNLSI